MFRILSIMMHSENHDLRRTNAIKNAVGIHAKSLCANIAMNRRMQIGLTADHGDGTCHLCCKQIATTCLLLLVPMESSVKITLGRRLKEM